MFRKANGFLLGNLSLDCLFNLYLLKTFVVQNLALLFHVLLSVLVVRDLDFSVHLVFNSHLALFELHLLSQVNGCVYLIFVLASQSIVLLPVNIVLKQGAPTGVFLVKVFNLQLHLLLKFLGHRMRTSTVNSLRQLLAFVHPRRKHVIVKSALRFLFRLSVAHLLVAKLLDQLFSVRQVLHLFIFLFSVDVGNLGSLHFGDRMLPSLLEILSLGLEQLSSEVSLAHLSEVKILLFFPLTLASTVFNSRLLLKLALVHVVFIHVRPRAPVPGLINLFTVMLDLAAVCHVFLALLLQSSLPLFGLSFQVSCHLGFGFLSQVGCQVFVYLQLAEPRQVRFLLLQLLPCHRLLSAPKVAAVYLRHCLRMRDSCGIVACDLVLSLRLRHLFYGLQPTLLDYFALNMISSVQILISFERPSSLSS